MNLARRTVFEALSLRVASAGVPFQRFFDPAQLAPDLHSAGFTDIEEVAAPEIDTRYFSERNDGPGRGGGSAQRLKAFVE
jgi:hypothetical protein